MAGRLLTDGDMTLYALLVELANAEAPIPAVDDLCSMLGDESTSTPPTRMLRLEQAGLIRVTRGQTWRQVTITATGRQTRKPKSNAVHWRETPMGRASGALFLADQAEPGSSDRVRQLAAIHSRSVPDIIGDILCRGIAALQAEMAVERRETGHAAAKVAIG